MILKRLAANAATGAVLVLALGVPTAVAGGPTTRIVDDDGKASVANGCSANNPVTKKIQNAINASAPGDIVLVCAGDYPEQLTISGKNGLTVRGVGDRTARVISPADMPDDNHVLVTILGANNVSLAHLQLLALAPQKGACEQVDTMVQVADSLNVTIWDNTIGTLGTATLGDCGYGVGIVYGDETVARGAPDRAGGKATYNYVVNFKFAGIVLSGSETVARANRNTVRYVHATYDNVPDATSRSAKRFARSIGPAGFVDSESFGIAMFGNARGVVAFNSVASGANAWEKGGTPVLGAGLIGAFLDRPLGAVRFADNRIHRTQGGAYIFAAEGVTLIRNTLSNNFYGAIIDEGIGNRVEANGVHENFVGILLTEFTSANQIVANDATNNEEVDCVDQTDDKDGVDNFWNDNVGDFSEPSWLCADEFLP